MPLTATAWRKHFVLWTAMPKTGFHEHGVACSPENHIGLTKKARSRPHERTIPANLTV
jgi:hypothetical protein